MKKKINTTIDEVIDVALSEIADNVKNGDMTAIQELLKSVPKKNLLAFLPEEFTKRLSIKEEPTESTFETLKATAIQVYPLKEPMGKTVAFARGSNSTYWTSDCKGCYGGLVCCLS